MASRNFPLRLVPAGLLAALAAGSPAAHAQVGPIRVSVDDTGGQLHTCTVTGCKNSSHPDVDDSGTRVVWDSDAFAVVMGVPNQLNVSHIYVRDVPGGTTQIVSVNDLNVPANDNCRFASISGDGLIVAFASDATNLVSHSADPGPHIYVRDLGSQSTQRVTELPGGAHLDGASRAASISIDGRFVSFTSRAVNHAPVVPGCPSPPMPGPGQDIYLADRSTGLFEWISIGHACSAPDGESFTSSITNSGNRVAFSSRATNLLASPDRNGSRVDVFLRSRVAMTTNAISVVPGGGSTGNGDSVRPKIAGNGGYVVFDSSSSDLVAGDLNARQDVFVRNLAAQTTVRVSVGSNGVEGDDHSFCGTISEDGRFVVFASGATNLAPRYSRGSALQLFAHDRDVNGDGTYDQMGDIRTWRISAEPNGTHGNGKSGDAGSLSANGRCVPFLSESSNLVPGDTNGTGAGACSPSCPFGRDVFLVTLR